MVGDGFPDLTAVTPLLGNLDEAVKEAHALVCKHLVARSKEPLDAGTRFELLVCSHVSVRGLAGYATLDSSHVANINEVIKKMIGYAEDPTLRRPQNFLMLASPGSGKSHLVECIAQSRELSRRSVDVVNYNMATFRSTEDLAGALDAARNAKVRDRLPLLFLDEFDSSASNYSLLLPLLWDGMFTVGQRELRMGKIVIVLAGSADDLPDRWEEATTMSTRGSSPDSKSPKIVDLFSRINGGVVRIPPLEDPGRKADKVVIAIQLLRKRFGSKLRFVARGLLEFIANVDFNYDARSLTHLIDQIPTLKKADKLMKSDLRHFPAGNEAALKGSNLAQHLYNDDGALRIMGIWKSTVNAKHGSQLVPIFDDRLDHLFDADTSTQSQLLYSIFEELADM